MSTTLPMGGTDPVTTAPAQEYASLFQDTLLGEHARRMRQPERERAFPVNLFVAWRKRQKAIAQLQYLLDSAPDHILADVGLSRHQVEREVKRLESIPFFRP